VRSDLVSRGYTLEFQPRTAGPITAIEVDAVNGTLWGGVSNHGEDHGVAW
jgi:gamma-glutamyltranspeptidase/glutathione hydrolase